MYFVRYDVYDNLLIMYRKAEEVGCVFGSGGGGGSLDHPELPNSVASLGWVRTAPVLVTPNF